MVRAVILDFNGVLVNDEPIHLELFQQVLGEEGVSLSAEDYYRHYLGFDDRDCFRTVLGTAGQTVDPPRLERLIARKASYYTARVHRDGYPFFSGAVELVLSIAARGWMLGLVSGALREEVLGALGQADVEEHFKVLITAEDVEAGKPDPEGYRSALQGLNAHPPLPERLLHPHEVVAVEDSPAGLESAAGAGLRTLAVAHTYPAAELGAADAVVDSLTGLTAERLESLLADVVAGGS